MKTAHWLGKIRNLNTASSPMRNSPRRPSDREVMAGTPKEESRVSSRSARACPVLARKPQPTEPRVRAAPKITGLQKLAAHLALRAVEGRRTWAPKQSFLEVFNAVLGLP